MSRGTADLVGLSGKGRIAVGADADLVVLDESLTTAVDVTRLAHRNPVSAYDGRELSGAVTATVLGGRLLPREAGQAGQAGESDERTGRLLRRPR